MSRKKPDHLSRKFLLTVFFACTGAVALFTGQMDGGTYVALATLILGVYGASNVMDKRGGGSGDAH